MAKAEMTPTFTDQQTEAITLVKEWFTKKDKPFFYLCGFAGTGKTTLAKAFAELSGGDVRFAAFTGKAAKVLRQKGCARATTIHSLIYKPKTKSQKRLVELREKLELFGQPDAPPITAEEKLKLEKEIKEEKDNVSRPSFEVAEDASITEADLVIVDECSMISKQIAQDLLKFNVPILFLGDTAQLPPVRGASFFESLKPDFSLTEIHRQAEGSPVLKLATHVRCYPDTALLEYEKFHKEDATYYDQILVGKNDTRRIFNEWFRNQKAPNGFQPNLYPLAGDKLVCLKNDHELGLLNGMILNTVTNARKMANDIVLTVQEPEEKEEWEISAITEQFERYKNANYVDHRSFWERKEMAELDYAYALTVHKAQGSQWDNVLLLDDGFGWRNLNERRQWLYTAITRAAKTIKICKFKKEDFI
jgi:exodeoxyribonuclease-5